MSTMYEAGREAANQVLDAADEGDDITDPRTAEFVRGVMDGLVEGMAATRGVIRRMIAGASAAAEDTNVEPFQGLVEVLQNADDLGASQVRFALAGDSGAAGTSRRLLIVHDGAPVTCSHVLPMSLAFLTTKSSDADLKGRFGIGLKTLRRIAERIVVHGAPYHFSADALKLDAVEPAPALSGFYDPATDTLLELTLTGDFSLSALEAWFAAWDEEGLIFLKSVRRFAWRDLVSGEEHARVVEPGPWAAMPLTPGGKFALTQRRVAGGAGQWTVYRALADVPPERARSHKATARTTAISIAAPDHVHDSGLFVAFRTRIPVSLPFSLDAQFDPSAGREGLIDNSWNEWLIGQCGEVVGEVALALLRTEPSVAWPLIPLKTEGIGLPGERWPRTPIDEALTAARARIAADGAVLTGGEPTELSEIAYESADLTTLLIPDDIRRMASGRTPLDEASRDRACRWREVLQTLGVSAYVGPAEVAAGFQALLFDAKPVSWWVDAGARLTLGLEAEAVFGVPCWLTDAGTAAACLPRGKTARPLVTGEALSDFAKRWALFERLHDAYAVTPDGETALSWLNRHAAVAATRDPADELEAFAERFSERPFQIGTTDLVQLRDRFDQLTDRQAEPLGPKVGRVLLLEGFVWRKGKRIEIKVAPTEAYLSRTLDSDHPFWPDAAEGIADIPWLSAAYDRNLKTTATRQIRKRDDGTISRGPRKFLMLLGSACTPRVIESGERRGGGPYRQRELLALGAEFVDKDWVSPDLDRVLANLERASKKDRKVKSAALIKALSRYWTVYADKLDVMARHLAITLVHDKGKMAAEWLAHLRQARWVAVGNGEGSVPSQAVVRSPETLALYSSERCIFGVTAQDVHNGLARTLSFITEVQASDLVGLLENWRRSDGPVDAAQTLQIYRTLARLCPGQAGWNTRVGNLTVQELRQRFGAGLIWTASRDGDAGAWRRPQELFTGPNIFLDPARFAPGDHGCRPLWAVLGIARPTLDACLGVMRALARLPYGREPEEVLIEIYRYIEPLVAKVEKGQRDRLRTLPVGVVGGGWSRGRPVYQVEDRELRQRLADVLPAAQFWAAPSDVPLPNLRAALGLIRVTPVLAVRPDAAAAAGADAYAETFRQCVDRLANELARNDPALRRRLTVDWGSLRAMTLAIHPGPFEATISAPELSPKPIVVQMRAVLETAPLRLNADQHALGLRDHVGRAIAQLFPSDARRGIEAEWVTAWASGADAPVEMIRTATDEDHARAMAELAETIPISPADRIKVTSPANRTWPAVDLPARRLKKGHGGVLQVTVIHGEPPKPPSTPRAPLADAEPPAPPPSPPAPSSRQDYSTAELEQRGWEVLRHLLNASDQPELVDFRKRHGVGADGVIDWTLFVEMKASAGPAPGSVAITPAEYERARERGLSFVLAQVSGLEDGYPTQVRLVFDPVRRATVRPTGMVHLTGLAEAWRTVIVIAELADDAKADPKAAAE